MFTNLQCSNKKKIYFYIKAKLSDFVTYPQINHSTYEFGEKKL